VEIVNAIKRIAKPVRFDVSSVYETDDRGSADAHWIRKFAQEGGKIIMSADADFFRKPHQVIAVQDNGMILIHLPPKWANAKLHLQAAHILAWRGRLESKFESAKPRECWRPDWNISEDGEMKRVSIDFECARKKLKKANRPSRQMV
jgi:PIN like domain